MKINYYKDREAVLSKKKITILQHRLLHYRENLFSRLNEKCTSLNIDFHLVHGQASRAERLKKDEGYLPWATRVRNLYYRIGNKDLLWQPLPKDLLDSDLFIVMQENKIISNYPILFKRLLRNQLVAYWGHGVNFQSNYPKGFREKWKRFLVNKVDWWFAYTDSTVKILTDSGYPAERITCLDNTIDTDRFRQDILNIPDDAINKILNEHELDDNSIIALFCGSLYKEKKINFLLQAADLVYDEIKDFRLIFIGDGPEANELMESLKTRPWAKWVGAKRGKEKAAYYKISKLVLNPGAIGLNILDSFCAGLPMFSTTSAKHGPEIAYLKNNVNGFITNSNTEEFSSAIIGMLRDPIQYNKISSNAYDSSQYYSIENMTDKFTNGILQCLQIPVNR
jgi:glycosyltransferase involved in cell wall biosynthesis